MTALVSGDIRESNLLSELLFSLLFTVAGAPLVTMDSALSPGWPIRSSTY
jgi:hypothetical protein